MGLIWIIGAFAFGFGACIASFLNVVIWRVPRGESIVRPPSHCPKCNAAIKWYQNLPILSWLALRGQCANCQRPISPRYVLIEFLGGALFLLAYLKLLAGVGNLAALATPLMLMTLGTLWIWFSLMIVGSMIDFDHQLLPDFVTLGGMVLGLVYNGFVSFLCPTRFFTFHFSFFTFHWPLPILQSLLGLGFGFGLLWLVRFLGSKCFRREAMGMGDVFLMGAVGAISGPVAVLFTLIFSSLLGTLVGVGMIALSKARLGKFAEIPYGPYICAAHLLFLFYGPAMIGWYLGLLK